VSRPYYNYSGGEKFIIDLSLRIALSVILLRRKGCNNSTLIIDEGFGSLDNGNNDKVLKLISLIKEKFGFRRILVITHVTDIKDNLNKKIEVVKINKCSELRYNINEEKENA
jgi:exonuclease SbcC